MAYLLDTNIFIQAKNEYYGFDLCPGFWDWLERQNKVGQVWLFGIDYAFWELKMPANKASESKALEISESIPRSLNQLQTSINAFDNTTGGSVFKILNNLTKPPTYGRY